MGLSSHKYINTAEIIHAVFSNCAQSVTVGEVTFIAAAWELSSYPMDLRIIITISPVDNIATVRQKVEFLKNKPIRQKPQRERIP